MLFTVCLVCEKRPRLVILARVESAEYAEQSGEKTGAVRDSRY